MAQKDLALLFFVCRSGKKIALGKRTEPTAKSCSFGWICVPVGFHLRSGGFAHFLSLVMCKHSGDRGAVSHEADSANDKKRKCGQVK